MNGNTLPDEPSRRKIIMVLDPDEIENLQYEEDGPALLLNNEVHVLSSQLLDPSPIDQGLVSPGAVLVQNPFDKNQYQRVSEAVENFALHKHQIFSAFCRLLGAHRVAIQELIQKRGESEITHFIGGGVPGVGVEGRRVSRELESFFSNLILMDEYEGGKPNTDAATELLRRTGLLSDPMMRGLLDTFQDQNNKMIRRMLLLNLTTEVHRNLRVLANLKIPRFLTHLQAGYGEIVQEHTNYTLTLSITVDF